MIDYLIKLIYPFSELHFRSNEISIRRGGRVVEGARLESVYTGNRIVGSNPTLSAIISNDQNESKLLIIAQ